MRVFRLVVFLILLTFLPAAVQAQGDTGVRLVVLTGDDQPVAGLSLTLVDDVGTSHTLLTDAAGAATLQPLPGSFFRITHAQQQDGTVVSIDATTLDDGLRLGLIPTTTRTVLLRLAGGLLFVDPDTIFAGTDAQHTIATAEALARGNAASVATQSIAPSRTDVAEPPMVVQPVAEPPRLSRWPFVVVVASVVLVPLGVLARRAVIQMRRQGRRTT